MKIGVVGLGYVGLPLACELSKKYTVFGFDIKRSVVDDLNSGIDRTGEIGDMSKCNASFYSDPTVLSECDFVIVAVPTPIDDSFKPDLGPMRRASSIVGGNLKKGAIVVFESTVYPGVIEDVCVPILAEESGLKYMKDFFVGYSPERINPGDKKHTLTNIVKVVAGCDKKTLDKIADVYSSVVKVGVHKASSIKVAEASKVIENIQRGLNIALMNELSLIFSRLGIDTREVLEAAGTKWNFHKYFPGLVGGHCIGVDPYYLTYIAQEQGYYPKIILSGCELNERMANFVGESCLKMLSDSGVPLKKAKIGVFGLTFKENVPDTRNSKAGDIIRYLKRFGVSVIGCDPRLKNGRVMKQFGVVNVRLEKLPKLDCAVLFSPHSEFGDFGLDGFKKVLKHRNLIDIKAFFDRLDAKRKGFRYLRL